jgi:PhnB protein
MATPRAAKKGTARKAPKKRAAAKKKAAPARAKAKASAATSYPAVTPYLCCKGAAGALDFYKTGFGAKERMRMTSPDGTIGHAEILLSGEPIMLSDEYADMGVFSPTSVGGSPVTVHVYVKDVDAFVNRAVSAGATILQAPQDMPYGDRTGTIRDPYGHRWMVATKQETVGKAALRKRFGEAFRID